MKQKLYDRNTHRDQGKISRPRKAKFENENEADDDDEIKFEYVFTYSAEKQIILKVYPCDDSDSDVYSIKLINGKFISMD